MDAMNPAYLDVESLPDQEGPVDPQRAISPFALTDHLSNFFRSHKSTKSEQKSQARPVQASRALSPVKEEESVESGGMPVDEQEECYKQQNIDPPAAADSPEGSWSKTQGSRAMPIMDVAQGQQPSYVHGQIIKSKVETRLGSNGNDKLEVYSLYSDPENANLKRGKQFPQSKKTPSLFDLGRRVYKPLGVEAQFPVYDEDIDFNPDPLQGILDDKYWLDQQNQESVIKKYIDLAANNMMPPDMEVEKRSVVKTPPKVKSVNSRVGLKDAEGRCPCKQVVACGECSKAKARKKSNYTETDEGVSYGRKLLSVDYDRDAALIERNVEDTANIPNPLSSKFDNDELEKWNEEETQIDEDHHSFTTNHFNRKLLSYENNFSNGEEVGENEKAEQEERALHLGRKILWYYDESEENLDEDENDKLEYQNENIPDIAEHIRKLELNQNVPHFNTIDRYIVPAIHRNSELPNDNFRKSVSQKMESSNLNSIQNPVFDTPNKPPEYYTPNKLANVLQKPAQQKPKGPKKTKEIVPSEEFEIVRNETFYNASVEQATEIPNQNKTLKKRGNEKLPLGSKGRRSFPEMHLKKNAPYLPLFQSPEDMAAYSYKEQNKTSANTSGSSTLQTESTVNTTLTLNITTAQPNVTTLHHHDSKATPRAKDEEEEAVDAEVANDIVETVISESQSSSVLGHNLGICKRNESLMSIKYGKMVPETEKVLKTVTDCIMGRLKSHLAKQSCILLDAELLEFLKWMVLSGESYKDYMKRMSIYYDFLPPNTPDPTTCGPPTTVMCDQEPPPFMINNNMTAGE